MKRKPTRELWWGREAQCSRCYGWWPADKEFFVYIVDGDPCGACRACINDYNAARMRRSRSEKRMAA